MSKYEYSKAEQQLSNVLNYQAAELKNIQRPDMSAVENRISESEKLLSSLGYPLNNISKILCEEPRKMLSVPTWEDLCAEAVRTAGNSTTLETVCLLSKLHANQHIEVELQMDELDLTAAESKATYEEIKEYVLKQSGLKVSNLYIAQVKQKCGIIERENYNLPKSENSRQPKCLSLIHI